MKDIFLLKIPFILRNPGLYNSGAKFITNLQVPQNHTKNSLKVASNVLVTTLVLLSQLFHYPPF